MRGVVSGSVFYDLLMRNGCIDEKDNFVWFKLW
jgi:hypothetical protein